MIIDQSMFPLRCAQLRMCARTQVVRQAHTRKLRVHKNVPSKNVFCTYFIHVIPNSDEFW